MIFPWEKKIENKVKEYLNGYSACHDFYHLRRVKNIALKIAQEISCDKEILVAAALLHDIGYKGHEKDDRNHAKHGCKIAQKWLHSINFPKAKLGNVLEVIRLHDNFPHMAEKYEPTDHVETKIIQDADRIEVLGAIGIARTAYYFGERNKPIYSENPIDDLSKPWSDHSLLEQLKRYGDHKWQDLNFDISKQISKERHDLMVFFCKELSKELQSEGL